MSKTIVSTKGPLGGGLRIKKKKSGVGLKTNIKTMGLRTRTNTGITRRNAIASGNINVLGKVKASGRTRVRYNNRLGTEIGGNLKMFNKKLLSTSLKTNANTRNAGLEAKVGLGGIIGVDAHGNIIYGRGIPSVGMGGGLNIGRNRLGGGVVLGGPKIFDLELEIPIIGKIIDINDSRKVGKSRRTTKTKKRHTTKTKKRRTTKTRK